MSKLFRNVMTAFLMAVSFVTASHASNWLTGPVTIIVPFAAGGGGDSATRILQERLSQELKQPVIIHNIVGASGIIGTDALKKSSNNGLTIGLSLGSTIGTGQIFNKEMPYNYATDFEYVAVLGEIPRGLFVSSNGAYNSINDVIADRQGNKSFGVPGNSPDHVNAVIFNSITNSNHQLIPYTANTNTMIMDLLGGRLAGVWQSLPAMQSCLQNNTCKLIAIASSSRHANFKEVPTFKELKLADVAAPSYYGFIAPKDTPAYILRDWNRAINTTLNDPTVIGKLFDAGVIATPKNLDDSKKLHFNAVEVSRKAAPFIAQQAK